MRVRISIVLCLFCMAAAAPQQKDTDGRLTRRQLTIATQFPHGPLSLLWLLAAARWRAANDTASTAASTPPTTVAMRASRPAWRPVCYASVVDRTGWVSQHTSFFTPCPCMQCCDYAHPTRALHGLSAPCVYGCPLPVCPQKDKVWALCTQAHARCRHRRIAAPPPVAAHGGTLSRHAQSMALAEAAR